MNTLMNKLSGGLAAALCATLMLSVAIGPVEFDVAQAAVTQAAS